MARYLWDLCKHGRQILKAMDDCNTRHENLEKRLNSAVANTRMCSAFIERLKDIESIFQTQKSDYSNTMINVITNAIHHGVNRALVGKSYQVELIPDVYRGKSILKLFFIDEKGKRLPPKIVEGDMLNQVLSFSAVTILSLKNGFNRVYYDEAFASANPRSLIVIRQLIQDYIDMGVQFVFVTQNPMLLYGLDRHVVELVSDGLCVTEVREYDLIDEVPDTNVDNALVGLFDLMSKGGDVNGFLSSLGERLPSDSK